MALAQFDSEPPPDGTICPLSDAQTQKSIDAFSKIASVITRENRCLGCHGRVNPYIDGIGEEKGKPGVPKSLFEHGGGKVVPGSDCNGCHNSMARRTKGNSESIWMTAPDFLAFVGRDAATICKQIRGNLPTAKDFLGHLKDDNGGNNFAGTAFNGDRGLDRTTYPEKEIPTEKPRWVLVNLLPLHDRLEYWTVQNIGTAFCPYRIQQKSTFFEDLKRLNYDLLDVWENPEKSCEVAFSPEHCLDRYFGAALKLG